MIKTPASFQQFFLEAIYTLYPQKFSTQLAKVWKKLANNKVKAIALEYLKLANHFSDASKDSSFFYSPYFLHYINHKIKNKIQTPTLKDFLNVEFLPKQSVIISVQHSNRNKTGYLIFRNDAHHFLVNSNKEIIKFPQLARSISNLPWYITNGNTPQGLYKIVGIDSSTNLWIGPTPNLQLVLPFEDADNTFFTDTVASLKKYKELLGNLSKFSNLMQSYFAGKMGRTEIIAHGTTIPESFYSNEAYYPCTPSLGCLCSPEIWGIDGYLKQSSQKNWINVLKLIKPFPIYLLVVEID